MKIWRLTQEDILVAKRLVDEKKRLAFSCGQFSLLCLPYLICFRLAPDFNGVVDYHPILESDKQEYYSKIEHLDQLLFNIEKYIHLAFAVTKKEDLVERMFTMVSQFDLALCDSITTNTTGYI